MKFRLATIKDKKKLLLFLCSLFALSTPLATADVLSAGAVNDTITKSRILSKDARVQGYVQGSEVTVTAFRSPKTDERDIKIDAVLVAKAVTDAFPSVKVVKSVFYNPTSPNQYRYVIVPIGTVEQFAKGTINDELLLNVLTVIRGTIAGAQARNYSGRTSGASGSSEQISAAPGPYLAERQHLINDIILLKNKGVDVSKSMQDFNQIETSIRSGNLSIAESYNAAQARLEMLSNQYNKSISTRANPWPLPVEGPEKTRRSQVFFRLRELAEQGRKVDELKNLFYREVELNATGGNSSNMESSLRYLENQLRIH